MTFTNYTVLCKLSCVFRHVLQSGENSKSCEDVFAFSFPGLLRKSTNSCWVNAWLLALHWGFTGPARVSLWILKVGTFLENRKYQQKQIDRELNTMKPVLWDCHKSINLLTNGFSFWTFLLYLKRKEYIILPDCCLQHAPSCLLPLFVAECACSCIFTSAFVC